MTSPAAFEGGEDEEADENANENTLDVHSAEPSPRERRKEKKRKEKKREERERKGGKKREISRIHASNKTKHSRMLGYD